MTAFHVVQECLCVEVDKCSRCIVIGERTEVGDCLWDADFSMTVETIIDFAQHLLPYAGLTCGQNWTTVWMTEFLSDSCCDRQLGMSCLLRFRDVFHHIMDDRKSIDLTE